MKNKMYMALVMTLLVSVAGCGKKDDMVSSVQSAASSAIIESNDDIVMDGEYIESGDGFVTEEAADETGVYPGSEGIAEIPMGVTSELCTIKIPLNYVIAGCYLDENGTSIILDGLESSLTTVQDGIDAGSFYQNRKMTYATWTSAEFHDGITITAEIYDKNSDFTFEDVKAYYPDGKAFGTSDVPAWLYHEDNELEGIHFSVCMQLSSDAFLNIQYIGPLDSEIGEEEAAQRIYDLVTIK